MKLEYVQVGGTRCSSEAALGRFYAALQDLDRAEPAGTAARQNAARERHLDAVDRQLAALGF